MLRSRILGISLADAQGAGPLVLYSIVTAERAQEGGAGPVTIDARQSLSLEVHVSGTNLDARELERVITQSIGRKLTQVAASTKNSFARDMALNWKRMS